MFSARFIHGGLKARLIEHRYNTHRFPNLFLPSGKALNNGPSA